MISDCPNRRAAVLLAASSARTASQRAPCNASGSVRHKFTIISRGLLSTYLRQILGFIGITDVNVILAGSTLAIMRGETTMDELTGKLAGQIALAAA